MKRRYYDIVSLFKACGKGKSIAQLHSILFKSGYIHDAFFASKLNGLYAKYTPLFTARKFFDETPHRTLYVWNSILRSHCRERCHFETLVLLSRMLSTAEPDYLTICIALKACIELGDLRTGRVIHGLLKMNEKIGSNLFVGSALIKLYAKCGFMKDALRAFEEYPQPDVVLWTTIVTGYEQNGDPEEGLAFFSRMLIVWNACPDPITFVSVVSACTQLLNLKAGKSVHGFVIRLALDTHLSLANALLNLYAKTGSVSSAANLFQKMEQKDAISWGSMIACYAHNGGAFGAIDLFNEMIQKRTDPGPVAFISAAQACEAACNLEEGKKIHQVAAAKGFELDTLVSTALIEMYMNCSSPDEAVELFTKIPKKDAAAWAALLSGCVQNRMLYKSMEVFRNMLYSKIKPDAIDLVKILTACSGLGILQQAVCLHGYVVRRGFIDDSFVGASLIESYAKCGSLDNAIKVFKFMIDKDVVVWSTMVAAYGIHGHVREALELFDQMVKNPEVRPNEVTFLSALSACSHGGLVKEGVELFSRMVKEYELTPNPKHYGIIVDLLGRTGELDKAMDFIRQMPLPVGPSVWGALLGACKIHQRTEVGEAAAWRLFQLDPGHDGYYVLLSNMYAADGKWDDVAEVRNLMKEKSLRKVSGESMIEV